MTPITIVAGIVHISRYATHPLKTGQSNKEMKPIDKTIISTVEIIPRIGCRKCGIGFRLSDELQHFPFTRTFSVVADTFAE